MLAAPLTISLSGDRSITAAFAANAPCSQHQVNATEHIIDTLGMLLNSARVEQKAGPGTSPDFCDVSDECGFNPADRSGPFGCAIVHRISCFRPAGTACTQKVMIQPVISNQFMKNRLIKRAVRSWT